jgi:hypothetical protein
LGKVVSNETSGAPELRIIRGFVDHRNFDPGDFGLAALLYFGEFMGGELQLGSSFCKTLSVKNLDLVFLNSSEVYHCSFPFRGNKVNIIFYSSLIKKRNLELIVSEDL